MLPIEVRLSFILIYLVLCGAKGFQDLMITDEFDFKYSVSKGSDIVLVKCPGQESTLLKDQILEMNKEYLGKNLKQYSNNQNYWIYVDRSNKLREYVECGRGISKYDKYKISSFKVGILWDQVSDESYSYEFYDITSGNKKVGTCSNNSTIALIKTSSCQFKEYQLAKDKVEYGDLLYFFDLKNVPENVRMLEPCAIVSAMIKEKPKITYEGIYMYSLTDIDITNNEYIYNGIGYITKRNEKEKVTFKMIMPMDSKYPNFYKKISNKYKFTSLQNVDNKKFIEIGEKKSKDGKTLVFDDYELIKVRSYSPSCFSRNQPIEKIYFIGPPKEDSFKREDDVIFNEKNTIFKAICPLKMKTFGILSMISFEDEIVSIDLLKKMNKKFGNFILEGQNVVYDKPSPEGVLKCTYSTPVSKFYILTKYISKDHHIQLLRKRGAFNDDIEDIDKDLLERSALAKTMSLTILAVTASVFGSLFLIIIVIFLVKKRLRKKRRKYDSFKEHRNIEVFENRLQDECFKNGLEMLYLKQCCQDINYNPRKWIFVNNNGFVPLVKQFACLTNRFYFISELPMKLKNEEYIMAIDQESIKTIVTFKSSVPETAKVFNDSDKIFTTCAYGSISTEIDKGTLIKNANVRFKHFVVEKKNLKIVSKIKLIEVYDWEINELPESISRFIDIYDKVTEIAGKDAVLLQCCHLPDPRVSLFAGFAYIVEGMINNKFFRNPINLLNEAKCLGHCGPLSLLEYGFLIASVFEYFIKKKIIKHDEKMKLFIENFNKYKEEKNKMLLYRVDNKVYHTLLNYINSLTLEKVRTYYGIHKKVYDCSHHLDAICKVFSYVDKIQFQNSFGPPKPIKHRVYKMVDAYTYSTGTLSRGPSTDTSYFNLSKMPLTKSDSITSTGTNSIASVPKNPTTNDSSGLYKHKRVKPGVQILKSFSAPSTSSNDSKKEAPINMDFPKVVRFTNIPCYDECSLFSPYTEVEPPGDIYVNVFLHGNELKYSLSENKTRHIVLCQSPLDDTLFKYVQNLYQLNCSVLVLMFEPEEDLTGKYNLKFAFGVDKETLNKNFLPLDCEKKFYGDYYIKKERVIDSIDFECGTINEYCIGMVYDNTSPVKTFKAITFKSDIKKDTYFNVHNYQKLYERIIEYSGNGSIFIQDDVGISTSSIIGLYILMVDTIERKHVFDPVSCLYALRNVRYGAVLYDYQFIFSIILLIYHYKTVVCMWDSHKYSAALDILQQEMVFCREQCGKNIDKFSISQ
uniref:Tyrosine-protein phosphatase domain-containing protein n=1 Tax=Parastrongyloides trichosuri TaxID=131310 RepID=A0A0N4ZEK9_PARTI